MSAEGTYNFERVSIQAVSKVPQDILLVPGFLRELLEQLAQKPGHEQYILRYFGHRLNRDTLKIVRTLR